MRTLPVLVGAWVALVASAACAHGPQIQITRDSNTITTRGLYLDSPYTSPSNQIRVYVIPLLETGGEWFSRPNNKPSATLPGLPEYNSGPGIAYGSDQVDGGPRDFAAGYQFQLNLIDGLKLWNGATFADPGLEQIEAYLSTGSPAATSDGLTPGAPATLGLSTVSATYAASAHGGISYRLLGDGASGTVASDDGVYLLSMTFSSTEPGLNVSEPFYFVLHKNALTSQVQAAIGSLGFNPTLVQVVPEPGGIWLRAACGDLPRAASC